jgi:hypothetical protein
MAGIAELLQGTLPSLQDPPPDRRRVPC